MIQRRCDKAYMSHDIPSRARIFGGGDRIWKAPACICACSSVLEESGRETKHGQTWRLLRS